MASSAYPTPGHNDGAVTMTEHEQLTASGLGAGIVGHPTTTSQPAFADGSGTRRVHLRAERRVVVHGFVWDSGASNIAMDHPSNAGATRIDRGVLRLDRDAETLTEEILTGTPGAGVPPALTANAGPDSGVWEFPLYRVTVVNGATTFAAEDVIPEAWYLGGQAIVTNGVDTAPGAAQQQAAGVRYDHVSDIVYVSTGAAWRQVYERSGKLNLTAAGGWTVGSFGAFVRRNNDLVTLQGQFNRVGSNLISGASLLTTLPEGTWPAETLGIQAYMQGSSPAIATLNTNGTLILTSYAVQTSVGEYVMVPAMTFSRS